MRAYTVHTPKGYPGLGLPAKTIRLAFLFLARCIKDIFGLSRMRRYGDVTRMHKENREFFFSCLFIKYVWCVQL